MMVRILNFSPNDEEYTNVIRMFKLCVPSISIIGVYTMYVDGIKKYIVRDNEYFYIINIEDGLFSSYDKFKVNENNIIDYLSIHGKNIMLKDGVVYTFNNDVLPNGEFDDDGYFDDYVGYVEKSVTIIKSDDVYTGFASYNASICYLEYNFDKETALFAKYLYQASFDGSDKISDAYCNVPNHINIVRLDTMELSKDDEEYYYVEWDRNSSFYNNIVSKFNNLSDCEDDNEYQFYYSKPIIDDKGRIILWNYFTSSCYYLDSLKNRIKRKGFENRIPEDLIDLYNGDADEYQYCLNIWNEFNKNKGLVLKRNGGDNK